jgi:hypothetical protein
MLFLSGCTKKDETNPDDNYGYSYWTGAIPNSYYLLNIYGERGLKISGKPFMILKYDKVTLEIIDCEMGLSEVTQTGIVTPSDFPVPPEPTLDASTFSYASKLGLKSPVDLLVQWNITGYATKSVINNGVQNFSFKTGNSPGGIGYNEEWYFSYNNVSMVGGVTNLDQTYYMGGESDNNAFNLLKQ